MPAVSPATPVEPGEPGESVEPVEPVESAQSAEQAETYEERERRTIERLFFDAKVLSVPPGADVYRLHDDEAYEYLGETPTVVRYSRTGEMPETIYVKLEGYAVHALVIDGSQLESTVELVRIDQ